LFFCCCAVVSLSIVNLFTAQNLYNIKPVGCLVLQCVQKVAMHLGYGVSWSPTHA